MNASPKYLIRLLHLSVLGFNIILAPLNAQEVDSLRQLKFSIDIEEKVRQFVELYDQYQHTDLEKATNYIDSAYLFFFLVNNDTLKYEITASYARNKWQLEDLDEALRLIDLALEYSHVTTELKLAYLFSTQGLIYYSKAEYLNAIEAHLVSSNIFEKHNNKQGIAKGFNNLGICYQRLEDWNKARKYHEMSLNICDSLNIQEGIAHNLGNLGIVYKKLEEFDNARIVYEKSLSIHKKLGHTSQVFQNYLNLSSLMVASENTPKAKYYVQQAINLAQEDPNLNNKALCKLNLGHILIEEQNYDAAERELLEAIDIYSKTGSKEGMKESYHQLGILYEKQGKHEEALQSRKLFEQWQDSIISETYMKRIADLEMKYKTQQKENEILRLSRKNQENEQALFKQRLLNRVLGLSLLLIVMGAVFTGLYFRMRSQKRKQEVAIQTIMSTQESERKRIAQDLHDSVGSILSLAKHKAEGKSDLEALIDQSCDELRRISYNLMPAILLKDGLIIAIQSLLTQVKRSNSIHTEFYQNIYVYQLDRETEFTLYRVVQELVQNVVKHAGAKVLVIHVTHVQGMVTIMVEDDGKGFDTNHNQGMGLQNIRTRVGHLKGELVLDSTPGYGTTAIVNIPLKS